MMLRLTPSRILAIAALVVFAGCQDDAPVEPVDTGGTIVTGEATLATLYDTAPNVGSCSEGVLKETERQKVLNYVNAIRANHGLPAVQYRHVDDRGTAKAALIIAANNALDHHPAPTKSCWSQEGFDASGVSNLAFGSSSSTTAFRSSESFVDLWIRDDNQTTLGHRRWLLSPFLKFVSFGRVDKVASNGSVSASVIQVMYDEYQTLEASTPDFVAFPFHETAARLFDNRVYMSISVLADRTDFRKNSDVSYAAATVTIRTDNGTTVPVTIVTSDNVAYGLANVLVWTAPVASDIRYTVTVRGVMVGGVSREYEYWFTTKTTT
jgi:uncharacterized protein YkwD